MCKLCESSGFRNPKTFPPEIERYRTHLFELAEYHRVSILEIPELRPHEAQALIESRSGRAVIGLAEVNSDVTYAIGLHELGHAAAPGGHGVGPDAHEDIHALVHSGNVPSLYDRLSEEVAAWAWAEAQAIEWTAGMEQTRQLATGSYLQAVSKGREKCGC